MELKKELLKIKEEFEKEITSIKEAKVLEELRIKYMGKNGLLTTSLKKIKDLSLEEKSQIGTFSNEVRDKISELIEHKKEIFKNEELNKRLEEEKIDITLEPKIEIGSLHPLTKTFEQIMDILKRMGFDLVDSPEIDTIYRNFDALNVPLNHPSRAESDTFYINDEYLLRTQTTTMQIRALEEAKKDSNLPIMKMTIGKVYRPDYDITHTPMFHQIEGLYLSKDASFAQLKGFMEAFVKELFEGIEVNFRPHYFPFTEPSGEIDIRCIFCKGEGCRVCKNSGWLEILGCGMINPNILENFGYDINEVRGWAFGAGLERIVMLKYGIDDLRLFFENDLKFLKQFNIIG